MQLGQQMRMRKFQSGWMTTLGAFLVLALQGCSGLGYQGGVIPSTFQGISLAQAVSPETFQLTWNAYPGSSKYYLYSPDSNNFIAEPGFNNYLYRPGTPDPSKSYQFAVTAVDPNTGSEVGSRSNYVSVQLLPHFNFASTAQIAPGADFSSLYLKWSGFPTVTYFVYLGERSPEGVVNYQSFASSKSVTGKGEILLTGLQEGHEYCAVAVAAYSDGSQEGPDGRRITGSISAALSSDAYMKGGASQTFGDSVIASSQQCTRTNSTKSFANMKVYAQESYFSDQPSFFVHDESATSSDGVDTKIYRVEDSGYGVEIGKIRGLGIVNSNISISSRQYRFYAISTDVASGAQARIEIIRGSGASASAPLQPRDRKPIYVRSLNSYEYSDEQSSTDTSKKKGYYPDKAQGGFGSQKAGTSVAIGDFNCDGHSDLAVGIPEAMTLDVNGQPARLGRVIVYYDFVHAQSPALSRSQEISFNFTLNGSLVRDLRLGTKLQVGNFNGDNEATNSGGGSGSALNQCDDLAISSGFGPMFVLYGTRNNFGDDGGLNFIDADSYVVNPPSACIGGSSNTCASPAVYLAGSSTSKNHLGSSYTTGDYDGDGFQDLALGTDLGVWVMRGSSEGLVLPRDLSSSTDKLSLLGSNNIAVNPGFGSYLPLPYLASSPGVTTNDGIGFSGNQALNTLTNVSWGRSGFGSVLGTLHNAWYDCSAENAGYDDCATGTGRVRDVLLIGGGSTGDVNVCKPGNGGVGPYGTLSSGLDSATGFKWDCSGRLQMKTSAGSVLKGFGSSMASIPNALQYKANEFITGSTSSTGYDNPNDLSNPQKLGFPGAVAIGDAGGNVYAFFGVARPAIPTAVPYQPSVSNSARFKLGMAMNQYLDSLLLRSATDDATTVVTANPCSPGSPGPAGGAESCKIQKITSPLGTSSDGSFGSVLAEITGYTPTTNEYPREENLAIASPSLSAKSADGTTYSSVGKVRIFRQNSLLQGSTSTYTGNSSTSGVNGVTVTEVHRYANGFNTGSSSTLDFDDYTASRPLYSSIRFGSGGIAGGALYSSAYTDVVVGVPGYKSRKTLASGGTVDVVDNGAAMVYFANGGQLLKSRPGDAADFAPFHVLDQSYGQESDARFNQAVSIGDAISGDGFPDLAVRVSQGSSNSIQLFKGGPNPNAGATRIQFTPFGNPVTLDSDNTAGLRLIPLGHVKAGSSLAYFATGSTASYLIYSQNGVIDSSQATPRGGGNSPRKFSHPGGNATISGYTGGAIPYLPFADSSYFNFETQGSVDSGLNVLSNFAVGDFNGDGYTDLAVGYSGSYQVATGTTGYAGGATGIGSGRVMIFYGGGENGFQQDPELSASSGGYPLHDSYFAPYTSRLNSGLAERQLPCQTDGTGCKIQMLYEEGNSANFNFGERIASIPYGKCHVATNDDRDMHALVVEGRYAQKLYVYVPKCSTGTSGSREGLVSSNPLIVPASPHPLDTNSFVSAITAVTRKPVGDASAGVSTQLILAVDQGKKVIHTWKLDPTNTNLSNRIVYQSEINFSTTNAFGGASLKGTTIGFGDGIVDAGDLNGDGWGDVVINVSKLDRRDGNQSVGQGGYLILFGSKYGLRVADANGNTVDPIKNAPCYVSRRDQIPLSFPTGGGSLIPESSSVCYPTLFFLPQPMDRSNPSTFLRNGTLERTFLSQFSGIQSSSALLEGLDTVILGSPGRDTPDLDPKTRMLQSGVFYVP